jgi:hypothetical protein
MAQAYRVDVARVKFGIACIANAGPAAATAPVRSARQMSGDTNDTIHPRQEMPALQALAMMA